MTLIDYARILRRGWITILLASLIGVAAGVGLAAATPARFAATAQLYVSIQTPDASTAVDLGQANTAAQQKVGSYTQVAKTSRVLQPVIDELHLRMSSEQLANRITVSPLLNTVVVTITAQDGDAVQSARIANAVGKSFQKQVGELDAPASDGKSLVHVEIVQPAVTPVRPISPSVPVNTLIGALAGFLLGLGATTLRVLLDTKIRGESDIQGITAAPVIGEIGYAPDASTNPLVVQLEPRSARAEAFRSLRTNLKFIDAENPASVFAVTSAMPSEGKTTTAANLAIALAEDDTRVVIIDADLRRPRLDEVMGIEGAVGLTDVLIGRVELDDATQPWGEGALSVIPAGRVPPNPSELLGSRAMKELLASLATSYDYVLLDAPPLLPVTDAAVLSKLTDGIVLLAAAGKSRRTSLMKATADLEHIGARILGIVVTMLPQTRRNGEGRSYSGYYGHAENPRHGRRSA